ncbi:MAG: ester cyclase [Deltaproteobacteria bacterium]|nr:ester cyclase [Deltaproteobacteria bacterium]
MSVEQNKATIRRVIDELRKGNLDIVDRAFSPNFAFHAHTHADRPLRGLEGARTMVTSSALSDVLATIEDIFGEGDRVAVRWTFRGVYRGEAKPGFPNPGEPCTIVAISTYRFVDGKIEDDWGVEALWSPNTPAWE